LRSQYEKEHCLQEHKAMLSKESKDKLSVNFMYEPPPGVRKDGHKEDSIYKFDWQRKYNAPRESYCKGDAEIRDQPFGIQVRNVRCIKCHKWGHINTDKECTLYSISMSEAKKLNPEPETSLCPKVLLDRKLEIEGLYVRTSSTFHDKLLEHSKNNFCHGDESSEVVFLRNLSKNQKRKLLCKLGKIEKLSSKKKNCLFFNN